MYKHHQCVCAYGFKSICIRVYVRALVRVPQRVYVWARPCVRACVELERTSKRARVRGKVKENWLELAPPPPPLSPPLVWSLTALATCTAWPSLSQQKLLISKSSM